MLRHLRTVAGAAAAFALALAATAAPRRTRSRSACSRSARRCRISSRSSSATSRSSTSSRRLITLMGGPPNVAALIDQPDRSLGRAGHARRPQRQRQEAGRRDVRRDAQPEHRTTRWSSSSSRRVSRQGEVARGLQGHEADVGARARQPQHRQGHSRQGRPEGRRLHHRSARHGPARQRDEGRHLRRRLHARAERHDHAQEPASARRSKPA